jgi:hypothetical protein
MADMCSRSRTTASIWSTSLPLSPPDPANEEWGPGPPPEPHPNRTAQATSMCLKGRPGKKLALAKSRSKCRTNQRLSVSIHRGGGGNPWQDPSGPLHSEHRDNYLTKFHLIRIATLTWVLPLNNSCPAGGANIGTIGLVCINYWWMAGVAGKCLLWCSNSSSNASARQWHLMLMCGGGSNVSARQPTLKAVAAEMVAAIGT